MAAIDLSALQALTHKAMAVRALPLGDDSILVASLQVELARQLLAEFQGPDGTPAQELRAFTELLPAFLPPLERCFAAGSLAPGAQRPVEREWYAAHTAYEAVLELGPSGALDPARVPLLGYETYLMAANVALGALVKNYMSALGVAEGKLPRSELFEVSAAQLDAMRGCVTRALDWMAHPRVATQARPLSAR
jgi:hypothetical protein